MIRRINIYGGPGVGKSTLAASIFAFMKKRGDNVELVQEFVKQFAYLGNVLLVGIVYMPLPNSLEQSKNC